MYTNKLICSVCPMKELWSILATADSSLICVCVCVCVCVYVSVPTHPLVLWTHMFMFCFALSMSFLISGVMLKRSFWGIGSGIMGARTIWVLFLSWHHQRTRTHTPHEKSSAAQTWQINTVQNMLSQYNVLRHAVRFRWISYQTITSPYQLSPHKLVCVGYFYVKMNMD